MPLKILPKPIHLANAWPQAELRNRLGISRGKVAYYESCAKNPTLEFLEKAAAVFEISLDELTGSEHSAGKRKPGPSSRLEQLTDELARLPKGKRRVVVQMLEGFLAQETTD